MKKTNLFVLALLLASIVAGCGKNDNKPEETGKPEPTPTMITVYPFNANFEWHEKGGDTLVVLRIWSGNGGYRIVPPEKIALYVVDKNAHTSSRYVNVDYSEEIIAARIENDVDIIVERRLRDDNVWEAHCLFTIVDSKGEKKTFDAGWLHWV
ncbi:hypothetical protein FACS1894159_03990 [Bacteroidia bacterium]|nr:hypothetical protein FACS1894159_03990 [Bacteroidia bacterium]